MYSEEYRDAMDYFRAIVAAEEHSERALELTEMIIRKNPAHYTVWRVLLEDAAISDGNLARAEQESGSGTCFNE
ncbi:MAG: CAAX geranylgeranyltransferase alpha subunit [Tremellales sp. Tagirdzhanova-0007]|nr:MAG: CAAX geranylgeranyltransferase alpha subunit [Tremellales sp. Tagirdzhanova-0007]